MARSVRFEWSDSTSGSVGPAGHVRHLTFGRWRLRGRPDVDRARRERRSWSPWCHPASQTRRLTRSRASSRRSAAQASCPSGNSRNLKQASAEGEHSTEPAELASRLVKDGILTEYQAKQVLKGKAQGLTFGSYVILEFLGKGTMGKVYKASHRMMGRVVALKILEPRYITSTRSLARFQREMQLVGRLDHPNVVRAFDADRVGDCHFIAMEYVDGFTLEDLLKARGALPPADVVYYGSQVADGLAHAHARGVLHRDIKPSNLLLTKAKKLKVLDFGLGTLLEKDELDTALTSAGLAVGTPDYISPEQARTVKIDPPQRSLLTRLYDVPPAQRATSLQRGVVDGLSRRPNHGQTGSDQ